MSAITYTFKKIRVLTDPSITEYSNVIAKIQWAIIFTDGTSQSIAGGITDLNTTNIQNFVPVENVTDKMLEEWVIDAEGGSKFISQLVQLHAPAIDRKTKDSKLTVYYSDPTYSNVPNMPPIAALGTSGYSGESGVSGS